MFLPLREQVTSEEFKVKDESEKNVHFDLILTEDDLLEFSEGKLIHPETDKICKNGKESAVILAVGTGRVASEDEIVSDFEEASIPLSAVEDLLHEDALSVLAFEL